METKILEFLPLRDLKIIKQIRILEEKNNQINHIGHIIYTRPLTPEYNLKKQEEEDKNNPNPLDKHLLEYPRQYNYPQDEMDIIIFSAIRKLYPNSILRNDTVLFNVDLDKVKFLKGQHNSKAVIYFMPHFSDITEAYQYAGKQFKSPAIPIMIYSNSSSLPTNIYFHANYPADDQEVLKKLESIKFE